MKSSVLRKPCVAAATGLLLLLTGTAPLFAAPGPFDGYWDLEVAFGERTFDSTLRIFNDEQGKPAGAWSSQRGEHVITEVAVEGDTLTFRRTTTFDDQQFESTCEGTASGDALTGVIWSQWGEAKVNGERVPADYAGIWELTTTSSRGSRKSVLAVQGDQTGTLTSRDRTAPLKALSVEDGQLSFTVDRTFGERTFSMEFEGGLEGDVLTGAFITERGRREVTGRQLAGKALASHRARGEADAGPVAPVRSEVINPIRNETLNKNGACRERKQGGNPRRVAGYLVFDGSMDGDRQVDPQIAVGGGHVLHGTNHGIIIYDKEGRYVMGVSQNCLNGGIDPKLFYDAHNEVFGFDLWNPWDKKKLKPVNISVSETSDPTGAWNTYPVPAPGGVDGGGIGYSRKWIGYSFPGGPENTFVLKTAEARAGAPATVYHFSSSLGHPVATQDDEEDLYFFQFTPTRFILRRVTDGGDGTPVSELVSSTEHGLQYVGWPPQSPQKGTDQKTASGDRNPKNLVLQGGYLWFSQAVNCEGRSAVQWHQLKLDGTLVQTGLISDPVSSYIQTTLAVNRNLDVLVGFQETSPDMYISPRMAYRRADDPKGTLRDIVALGEGRGATNGTSWGDYSGSVVDGDNHLDLWTIQSITDDGGKGDTVIAKVPITP